ncbi:MAG TPA: uridylate kinase [Methanospirillum sp.]|nr:uridylate kinase [Methanospirillum sp.]
MARQLVIKIGGSLLSSAGSIIRTINQTAPDALIIPGGGIFAEAVRDLHVEGTAAHWMAIAGMDQFGWYLSTFGMSTTLEPNFNGLPQIFLPYQFLVREDPLPYSWDITSDTISAWIAFHLKTNLLILKSIDQIRADGEQIEVLSKEIATTDLDPVFPQFIYTHQISGLIINGKEAKRITGALRGEPVLGTIFGTTI